LARRPSQRKAIAAISSTPMTSITDPPVFDGIAKFIVLHVVSVRGCVKTASACVWGGLPARSLLPAGLFVCQQAPPGRRLRADGPPHVLESGVFTQTLRSAFTAQTRRKFCKIRKLPKWRNL
jgi:hypothetical protein